MIARACSRRRSPLARLGALAMVGLGCGGIEGSPIGTAGQGGTETSTVTADGGGDGASTSTAAPGDDDGVPPLDSTTGADDTTSLGVDGSSTGGPPDPLDGSETGDEGAEDESTVGNDLVTGSDSGSGTETDTDTGTSGTDTGTGSSSDSG